MLSSSTVSVFEPALNVSVPSLPSPMVKLSFSVIVRAAPAAFIVTLLFCVVKFPASVNKLPPISATDLLSVIIQMNLLKQPNHL